MRRPEAEAGSSLIEILVTIVLLGVGMTGILWSWSNGISLSTTNRDVANLSALANSGAESVRDSARNAYVPCASTTNYDPSIGLGTLPTAYQLSIASVQYWNGTAFTATCNDTVSPFARFQQVTVRAAKVDGSIVKTVIVLKRDN